MGTPHSPKLQHYWNFTIRLFSVISRTLFGRVLPLCREAVGVFNRPLNRLGKRAGGFPFVSIYGQQYPTFRSHVDILPSDVPLTLLLLCGMSRLFILYYYCMGWKTRKSCSYILLGRGWHGRDFFEESCHSWIWSWYHIFMNLKMAIMCGSLL